MVCNRNQTDSASVVSIFSPFVEYDDNLAQHKLPANLTGKCILGCDGGLWVKVLPISKRMKNPFCFTQQTRAYCHVHI